jgi:superfamily II DNA or RNA helicase
MSMILRECQVNAIDSINKNQNGIIEMCCGSGKSLVISEIIKQYKVSVLFVPKNALFEQFVDNSFYSSFNFILINCKNDTQGSIDYNKNNVILTNMSSFHVMKK